MNTPIVLPILIPLGTAAFSFFFWKRPAAQKTIGVLGSCTHLVASLILLHQVYHQGILATQIGNWQAPFGISLAVDLFGAIMTTIAALMGFVVAVYSLVNVDNQRIAYGYYSFLHLLLMGVCGVFLTGDLFNMYVWFEVMLMSSFVLLALGGERRQLEGGFKYVTLNLISSAFFLTALGILYGMAGTLNMADLALQLANGRSTGMVITVSMLFFIAFGIKSALFPLFFWLPASYHTPPVAVSAIFAGLLTKVGVYSLIRVFTLLFTQDTAYTHLFILIIAGLTMVTGVLGAMAQNEFRRILSFHIISQVGYMVMGLGLFTPLAMAGAIFYIIHHIIVKTNLFLISGVARRYAGAFDLENIGGLYRYAPGLTILFFISAFSLAGIPPLSGFWAKFILVKSSLQIGAYTIAATALAVSLLTLFSMTKIWDKAFWREAPASNALRPNTDASKLMPRERVAYYLPMILLSLLTLVIGMMVEPFFQIAQLAAEQLVNPEAYIQAVLGARP